MRSDSSSVQAASGTKATFAWTLLLAIQYAIVKCSDHTANTLPRLPVSGCVRCHGSRDEVVVKSLVLRCHWQATDGQCGLWWNFTVTSVSGSRQQLS